MLRRLVAALALITSLCAVSLAQRGDPRNVVVVINQNSPISVNVANHYMTVRGITKSIVLTTQDSAASATNEYISYANYVSQIQTPVFTYLQSHPEIYYVVLTKGIPIRIESYGGTPIVGSRYFQQPARPSVDSILNAYSYSTANATLIAFGDPTNYGQAWINRFWSWSTAFGAFRANNPGIVLVNRLDGYTEADANALVDRSVAARSYAGKYLFDTDATKGYTSPAIQPLGPASGVSAADFNSDCERAANTLTPLRPSGDVVLDKTNAFLGGYSNLMGYASWGSNDAAFNLTNYNSLTFAPGGLAETAVSTDGRTFLPGGPPGQSLIADLIAQGATGAKGYVYEPFLNAIGSPTVMFRNYVVNGSNLAETLHSASRYVGWEDIVLGDPLCRPAGATVYGEMTPAAYVGDRVKVKLTIELLPPGAPSGSTPVETTNAFLTTTGSYSFSLKRYGTYDVRFKSGHWLARRFNNVQLDGYHSMNFEMLNGDVDGSGEVDDGDLTRIILGYGTTPNSSQSITPQPDIDGDGEIADSDLTICILNYGAVGE